ncbi:hypothetical protein RIR_jg2679.t1 [Rhizophagus irregularis DAOM 181602=DAOM 197198]|nr:hypothetical protein RIR_jg2679.t1 [Rhizophagus irregularis DAOM 181602=DAOM 197198]
MRLYLNGTVTLLALAFKQCDENYTLPPAVNTFFTKNIIFFERCVNIYDEQQLANSLQPSSIKRPVKFIVVSSSKCGHLGNIVNEVVVHPHKDIAIEMVCNYVQIQDNIVIEVYKWIVVAVDIADDVVVDVVGEVDVDVCCCCF